MTTRTMTIAANGGEEFEILANSISVEEAAAAFNVELDRERSYEMRQGHSLTGEPFRYCRIENPTDVPLTVKLHFAMGEMKGAGLVSNILLGTAAPVTDAVTVGTAVVQIAATNTSRRRVTFKNNGGGTVYIGAAGVTVAKGMPLVASEGFTTNSSAAAWYAIAASAGQEVRVLEES